jgi:hypothetical protein
MNKKDRTGDEDVWSYVSGEGAHLWKIVEIRGGRYLPVGEFKKEFFDGMSLNAFRRLDDGTFALCSFSEENLKEMKVCDILTVREFRGYLTRIALFFEEQSNYKKTKDIIGRVSRF